MTINFKSVSLMFEVNQYGRHPDYESVGILNIESIYLNISENYLLSSFTCLNFIESSSSCSHMYPLSCRYCVISPLYPATPSRLLVLLFVLLLSRFPTELLLLLIVRSPPKCLAIPAA